jgi:hypothetical protein
MLKRDIRTRRGMNSFMLYCGKEVPSGRVAELSSEVKCLECNVAATTGRS